MENKTFKRGMERSVYELSLLNRRISLPMNVIGENLPEVFQFKKTLESIVSKENHRNHKFYCCELNDATQLIETLDLNLYELLTQDSVQINVNAEANMDIYCRKIFDYSIERIYA